MEGIPRFFGYLVLASIAGPALPTWFYWGRKATLGQWMLGVYGGILCAMVVLYLMHGIRRHLGSR